MSGATDHLPRLLALVPWLLTHPNTPVDEIARVFDTTPNQVRDDVNLLWMCGLPGYDPGDLIDVTWHGDRVTLSNAETIARPLKLTGEEALALVAALRALSGVPGLVDTGSVDRALAKLEAAAGSTPTSDRIVTAHDDEAAASVVVTVTDGLARRRRLHLRYWVPARDEATERDVDPVRLFTSDGSAYLSGWCHLVGDVRIFRLDRVLDAFVLDEAIDIPAEVRQRALDREVFEPDPADQIVTLSLDPAARWIADYHPCESVSERGDGGLDVTLRVHDMAWMRRLALGLAGVGRVIDPPDLVADVRDMAISALAAYNN